MEDDKIFWIGLLIVFILMIGFIYINLDRNLKDDISCKELEWEYSSENSVMGYYCNKYIESPTGLGMEILQSGFIKRK